MSTDLSAEAAAEIAREDEIYQEAAAEEAEPVELELEAETETELDLELDEDGRPPRGFVPHGALHESREKEKQAKERAELAEVRAERMENRFNQILERIPTPDSRAQAPEVDFEADPIGGIKAVYDEIKTDKIQRQAAGEHAARVQQFTSALSAGENAFHQENPDYFDAYGHLVETRNAELQAIGIGPSERNQTIAEEVQLIAERAFANGENPAQVYYGLAKMRGYAPNANSGANAGANAHANAQADPFDSLATKQNAATNLGSGGVPQDNITLEALSTMDDASFERNFKKLWGRT